MSWAYTVKIDIDNKNPQEAYIIAKRLALLYKETGIYPDSVEAYETNKGYHVYITVKSPVILDTMSLLFLQLLLRSDWRREIFNFRRVLMEREEGVKFLKKNVLYKVKRNPDGSVSMERRTETSEWFEQTIMERFKYWIRKMSR